MANMRALLADIRGIWGADAAPKAAIPEQDTEDPPNDAPKDDQTKKPIDV
jgi:hypothetical protein